MKHQSPFSEELARLLDAARVQIREDDLEVIAEHLEWVLLENRVLNLTSITDPVQAMRLHVVDSLVALAEVQSGPEGRLLDIGTGGGYPGLPLAVASRRSATLIDSVTKKARAVSEFVKSAGLGDQVAVRSIRAEDLALEMPQGHSVVVARALSSLGSVVELASPNLRESGILVALKGQIESAELARGIAAGMECGMEFEGQRLVHLPEGGETRAVVVFRRGGKPRTPLPRRVGMAQKRPLG